jgi:three-Cys-motif partner protein
VPTVSTDKFFDESREQSLVKAEIVEKYFDSWAGIVIGVQKGSRTPVGDQKIGYVDLFAGPGRYKDGAVSTPLRILAKAVSKPDYCDRLVTIFNDKEEEHVRTLQNEIAAIPGIDRLRHKPVIWNEEVGDRIAADFERIKTIPLLAFVDPWGYKGLSLRLVDAFLKNWGCDCIFFFNYSRINAGLGNPFVREHMEALFGEERARSLSAQLEAMRSPFQREATIVEELASALKEHGGGQPRFVLPFCFKNLKGKRTTHHLVLVTKHFKGYDVMKGIMAKASSKQEDGVASFTYCPPTGREQPLLFRLSRPLDDLREALLDDFSGRQDTMRSIYEKHSVDTPFGSKNYKDVLAMMEKNGEICTSGRKSPRGFADDILVTFPERRR